MSYSRSPSGNWQVRREFSLTVASEADAKNVDRLVDQAHTQILRDIEAGKKACPTIREALDAFIDHQQVFRRNRQQTLVRYRRRLLRFADDLGGDARDLTVIDITREAIQDWIKRRMREKGHAGKYEDSKTICPDYLNQDLAALRRFARWCAECGYCSLAIPLFAVSPITHKTTKKPRALIAPKFQAILTAVREIAPHVAIILRAMVLAGARPEALFALDWHDVQLPEGKHNGTLLVKAMKGSPEAEAPIKRGGKLHLLLLEARETWKKFHGRYPRPSERKPVFCTRRGRSAKRPYGWTTSTYDDALARACRKAGIRERFTSYVARHSAITYLGDEGLSTAAIQHYAKHLLPSTQAKYLWTTGRAALPAYEAIEGFVE